MLLTEQAQKFFVVEYSITKGQARVRSVGSMLRNNLRDIVKNEIGDYVPVALLANRNQAELFAIEFRQHLDAEIVAGNDWQHISQILDRIMNQLLKTLSSESRAK